MLRSMTPPLVPLPWPLPSLWKGGGFPIGGWSMARNALQCLGHVHLYLTRWRSLLFNGRYGTESKDPKGAVKGDIIVGFDFVVMATATRTRPQQFLFAAPNDDHSAQHFVMEQCLQALAPNGDPTSFKRFSSMMKNILQGVWLGLKYEEGLHRSTALEGRKWKSMRIPFPIGTHAPLMAAFVKIPFSYYHPQHPLPSSIQTVPVISVPLSSATGPATTDTWLGISIRLSGPVLELCGDLDAVKQWGVLAYHEVHAPTVNQKVDSWDGSTHCLNLLCKTQDSAHSLRRYLQARFPGVTIRDIAMHDYTPSGYIGVYELGFVGEVFSRGLNQTMIQTLLDRAPALLIPQGPDTLPTETTELWTWMYSQDLFEYNRFRIMTTTSSQGRLPFKVVEVTFKQDVLEKMCLCRPFELSKEEHFALLHFCLILCRLRRFKRAFHQRIYPSEGSIYPGVICFIASSARQLFEGIELRTNEMLKRSGNLSQEEFESIHWQPKTGLFTLKVVENPPAPLNKLTTEELRGL
ncbi:uncharacterized protein EI90DRAFT_3016988 [Cantharellus anzutake]|uniref:uncharacterized protein n=1 Tax=Cantharellus anzutake TaxID=1750568 RepID=UPI00190341A2|nr:uncharacterized protein EI90DRAFT_3016988 [Cantharellus anzutake]KAF8330060.1 hypothetical protein EI90DRAFT_3016988 [Cantharellus anzutake]